MKSGIPPFFTVFTDMVSTHTWWFNQRSDLIFVPTEIARQRGLSYRLKPDQIRVVGLPVTQRFCQPLESGQFFPDKIGWHQEPPVNLLIGGEMGWGLLPRWREPYRMLISIPLW
jgi:hypothetical protein